MEKKEFPKKEGDFRAKTSEASGKISGISDKIFAVIKFTLGICLLPFVYSISLAFLNQFCLVEKSIQGYFWSGMLSFLILYLFIWEPQIIYEKGHKLLEIVFNFFKPLVRVAPYLLPIYTIILFVLYGILSLTIKSSWLIQYCIFLSGFSISLHLVFSAKSIRSKKSDFLKANYIFGFSFVYIINVAILAFCINLIFNDFSFVTLCNTAFSLAKDIFYSVFKQLFLR